MSYIEGPLVVENIEQQQILDRASVEPYFLESDDEGPQETDSLLGISKNAIPKRVMMLFAVICMYLLSALSTAATNLDLYYNYVCGHFGIDQEICMRDERASKTVANFIGVNTSIVAVFSLVVTSVLSIASDMIGRKPVFIMAMGVNCLAIVSAWYIYFHMSTTKSYWVMLVPSIIDGMGGGAHLVELLCIPYITDMVREAKHRTQLMAISTGCLLASVAVGPVTASWIVKHYGLERLYLSAAAGVAVSAVLTAIFVRESLSPIHRRRNSEAGPGVKRSARIITFGHIQDTRLRRNARILFICTLSVAEYSSSFWPVLILFPKLKFGWTAVESGYLLSSMFGTRTFWFVIGFPFLYKMLSRVYIVHSDRVDEVDRVLMILALVVSVLGSLALGWSRTGSEYFVSGVFDSCASMGSPVFMASLIKHVPAPQVGSFMAAFNVILSVLTIFTPSLIMQLYSVTLELRPSVTFEITAAIFAFILALSLTLRLE